MAIPHFNRYGNLPPGIHKATIKEAKQRLATNQRRKEIFDDFLKMIKSIPTKERKVIKSLILDGSYVTDKEDPGDWDCILIVKKDSIDFLESPTAEKLKRAKEFYNGDMILAMEDSAPARIWTDFFSMDKEGRPKGLIEIVF